MYHCFHLFFKPFHHLHLLFRHRVFKKKTIQLDLGIVDSPKIEVRQRQIVQWCVIGSVSCDSSTRRYVVPGIKATALQCTIPQVLSVAPAIMSYVNRPFFLLVDVGKNVDALMVRCIDIVKHSQQVPECPEFICKIWSSCPSDALEQAVPSKAVDFGDVGSFIYQPMQNIWLYTPRGFARDEPIATTILVLGTQINEGFAFLK